MTLEKKVDDYQHLAFLQEECQELRAGLASAEAQVEALTGSLDRLRNKFIPARHYASRFGDSYDFLQHDWEVAEYAREFAPDMNAQAGFVLITEGEIEQVWLSEGSPYSGRSLYQRVF